MSGLRVIDLYTQLSHALLVVALLVVFVLASSAGELLASPLAPQKNKRKAGTPHETPKDPWTQGKRESIEAAGWIEAGGAAWAADHDVDAVRKCLTPTPVLFLETPHFRIASTLAGQKISRKNKTAYRLLSKELERLAKRLDRLKPKKLRGLDPWLRVHLFAQRLEEQRADFVGILGEDGARGMPAKMNVILFERRTHLERYASQLLGRPSRIGIRDFLSDGTPILGTAAETGVLQDDRHLAGNVAFNVTHCLFDAYRGNHYSLPVWFREGLAHWFAQRIDPRETNRTQGENEDVTMLQNKDWDVLAQQLAKSESMRPLHEILEDTSFGKLRFRDHIACWSRIEYVMREKPGAIGRFIQGIKGQFDPKGASLRGPAVGERFRAAFRESFGGDAMEFDEKWKAWLKQRKRKKR